MRTDQSTNSPIANQAPTAISDASEFEPDPTIPYLCHRLDRLILQSLPEHEEDTRMSKSPPVLEQEDRGHSSVVDNAPTAVNSPAVDTLTADAQVADALAADNTLDFDINFIPL